MHYVTLTLITAPSVQSVRAFYKRFARLPGCPSAAKDIMSLMEGGLDPLVLQHTNGVSPSSPMPADFWESVSTEDLMSTIKATQGDSCFQISFRVPDIKMLKSWLTKCNIAIAQDYHVPPEVELVEPTKRPSPSSSTTQAKKSKTTCTSSTIAPTTSRDASASFFEDTPSSDDDLGTLLESVTPRETILQIGSSITIKKDGKSYTFKSDQFPAGQKYIDLKVCRRVVEVLLVLISCF